MLSQKGVGFSMHINHIQGLHQLLLITLITDANVYFCNSAKEVIKGYWEYNLKQVCDKINPV